MKNVLIIALPLGCLMAASRFYQYIGLDIYLAQLLAIVLTLSMILTFFTYPLPGKLRYIDYLLMIASALVGGNIAMFYFSLSRAHLIDPLTILFGVLMIILLIEAVRRVFGRVLFIVLGIAAIFPFLGPSMPGLLRTREYTLGRLVEMLYISPNGILGTPLYVGITIVSVYLVLGAFLFETNGMNYMSNLALRLFGGIRGGPAKVAIVCSAGLATITGTASGNVATSGVLTIPLMKKTGYKAETAGAIEAVASTGGIITPPIMGAVAFIIAEFLAMSYGIIVISAIIPAVLYYLALFLFVDLEAVRLNLKGLPSSELPSFKEGWRALYLVGIPIVFLVILLVFYHLRPSTAGLLALVLLIIISFFTKETRLNFSKVFSAFNSNITAFIQISLVCAGAGIIIGVVTLTGLGAAFVEGLFLLAGHSLFLALVLTALACIVLGMGMPAVGIYVVLAMLVVPALIELGAPRLSAHLFVFYFGVLSNVTPPVCIAIFVASAIAKSDILKTAIQGLRFSFIGFVLPFLLIYTPEIILQEGKTSDQILSILGATGFTVLFTVGISSIKINWLLRGLFIFIGVGLVYLVATYI